MIRSWFVLVLGLILVSGVQSAIDAADQPNVLLIVTDEHNFRTLGCYRDQLSREQAEMWGPDAVVETPHLDRIAREGMLCTRAYATAPVCSPCRGAMITGLYPQNNGVSTNNQVLRSDVPTLATILNEQGYRSGYVGKWHLAGGGKPEWAPKVDGGFQKKTHMFNRGHWKKFALTEGQSSVDATDKQGKPSYAVDGADESTFSTDYLTDRAIEFMTAEDDRPFLSVLSLPDPHGPNTVRAPYDHMYDHLRFLPPRTYAQQTYPVPGWLGNAKGKHPAFRDSQMSLYFGMVKCIDDNVGRILATLEKTGQLDSTIIVMTSDHGDLCYEHDRLNKGNPYEGSARVPLLVRYPAKVPDAKVVATPIGTVDLTPTLLRLAGVKANAAFQGRDLSGVFCGGPISDQAVTFVRNSGTQASWLAAIDKRYKLILSVNDDPWLFDAEQDPDELLNFYGRPGSRSVTKRLAKELNSYIVATNDAFGKNKAIEDSLRKCLK